MQSGVTALECLEYIRYFKVGLFHGKMNKTFQDYKALMRDEDNIDDPLTLSWFKAWLGLDNITNVDSKIKKDGNYEVHDQYLTEVGLNFLSNAFTNYLETYGDSMDVRDSDGVQIMILDFLEKSDVKFVYDPKNTEENAKYDDLLSYGKDLCSRTVLSGLNIVTFQDEGWQKN
jgi:hypothetical protein